MDFTLTEEQQAFRQELRQWLDDNIPDDWRQGRRPPEDTPESVEFLRAWQRTLAEARWAGIAWPREYGGRGAGVMEQIIYQEEMHRADAPPQIGGLGITMFGPILIQMGTEAQKQRYVPNILNGREIWCQGYSEPNAGSDLASLRTRAVLEGDRWVINGQKIWTSGAHHADLCFLLCRTQENPPDKHMGITALIVDMHQPGVRTRRIHQMNDGRHFNEVFFENAEAPADRVVGEVNKGWQAAVAVLGFERGGSAQRHMGLQAAFDQVVRYCQTHRRGGRPLIQDPLVRQRLADFHGRVHAAQLNFYRNLTHWLRNGRPGPEGSMGKLYCSELRKELMGFAVSLAGPEAMLWARDSDEGELLEDYLSTFGGTIAAGTSEIQKNTIGERVLGLPKDIRN
jgi:alkylation response protein AidB-like acyl-CoA dehydrogenase